MASTFLFVIVLCIGVPTYGAFAQMIEIYNIPPGICPTGQDVTAGPQPGLAPPIRIGFRPTSKLHAAPGTEKQITLQLKNDAISDYFYVTGEDEKKFFVKFDPSDLNLSYRQTKEITATIRVPPDAIDKFTTLTVTVRRSSDSVISQRQIIIPTKLEPDEKWAPTCSIQKVTTCDQYLDEAVCLGHYWMQRSQIQDTHSGLASISIKPDGRFLGDNFTVGTKDPVVIEHLVSCCTTSEEITAVDLMGNKITCRPDQYTSYLSTGDVIAISLGVILILSIVFNVILTAVICRCFKRRWTVDNPAQEHGKQENTSNAGEATADEIHSL